MKNTVTPKSLWRDDAYYAKTCVGEPLTEAIILEAETKLGYKFPASYLNLMKSQNGGKLVKNVWLGEAINSTTEYQIVLEAFYSIGKEKESSLFGRFSNAFWYSEWGYPSDVGIIIAETISGGHDMLYLDYRDCEKDGEPKVAICFQESDYKIVVLANTFEEFLSRLITEEELEHLNEA